MQASARVARRRVAILLCGSEDARALARFKSWRASAEITAPCRHLSMVKDYAKLLPTRAGMRSGVCDFGCTGVAAEIRRFATEVALWSARAAC